MKNLFVQAVPEWPHSDNEIKQSNNKLYMTIIYS